MENSNKYDLTTLEKEYNIASLKERDLELEIEKLKKNPTIQKYLSMLNRKELLEIKKTTLRDKMNEYYQKEVFSKITK